MIILPVLAAEQLQKIVLMKVCAVEKFGGRGGGRRPTVGTDLSTGIAGHSASEDARKRAYDPAIHPLRLTCFFSIDARA
jgi:hypothetical protein